MPKTLAWPAPQGKLKVLGPTSGAAKSTDILRLAMPARSG
jgi:hypothetical protein